MKEKISPYPARDGIPDTLLLGTGAADHLNGKYARKFVSLF
jgi:hypothetical protein